MPIKLEFETPEGRLSLRVDDAQFVAYDAAETSMRSMYTFVERMRDMGLGGSPKRTRGCSHRTAST